MADRPFDVAVIGAGLNGLVAAGRLAEAGFGTLVLERRSVPGGAAATEEIEPGFYVDTGLHDPGWLPTRLERDLDLGAHGLERLEPDPAVCSLLPEGGAVSFWRDPSRTAEALRAHAPGDAERWPGFVERTARHARILEGLYGRAAPEAPDPGPADLAALLRVGGSLRRLGRDGVSEFLRAFPMSAAEMLEEWFGHEGLKGALGATGCFGLFQGPRSAGTAFAMLHRQVGGEPGVYRGRTLVRGGSGRLGRALAAAAEARGADLRYETEVERVAVENGRVTGVVLRDGREIPAAAVVSGADPHRTLLSLVGTEHLEPEFVRTVRNVRYRGAWAKVNLALSGLPRFRDVDDESALAGVVTVAPGLEDLERAYDDAKYGRPSRHPSLEIRIPSLADPSLAPEGAHVMSVCAQYAPYHLGEGEWDEARREALGDRVVATLADHAPNLPDRILRRQVLTPADLEERFALPEGDASHGELALDQILFMRPVAGWARYATPVEGLYLCGPGTHPGPGIVGGSGELAARRVTSRLRNGR